MKRILSLLFGAAAPAWLRLSGDGAELATQRVTVVVPFGAGSVTDILARIFAEDMGKRWGQQVIVENRLDWPAPLPSPRPPGRLHADGDLQWPHSLRVVTGTRRSTR